MIEGDGRESLPAGTSSTETPIDVAEGQAVDNSEVSSDPLRDETGFAAMFTVTRRPDGQLQFVTRGRDNFETITFVMALPLTTDVLLEEIQRLPLEVTPQAIERLVRVARRCVPEYSNPVAKRSRRMELLEALDPFAAVASDERFPRMVRTPA